jgi:hypothetical protein
MGEILTNTKTNDKAIRKELIKTLLELNDTLGVVQELEVARGRVRADVVRLSNCDIHAYEIKSDLDTLRRLPRQIRYYNEVFSTVTLVVGIDHVVEALYIIPDWWGVIVAELNGIKLRLSPIRQEQRNTHTNYEVMSDLLRRHELVKVLSAYGVSGSRHSMSKQKLIQETQQEISKESLVEQLAGALLARKERLALNLQVTL